MLISNRPTGNPPPPVGTLSKRSVSAPDPESLVMADARATGAAISQRVNYSRSRHPRFGESDLDAHPREQRALLAGRQHQTGTVGNPSRTDVA